MLSNITYRNLQRFINLRFIYFIYKGVGVFAIYIQICNF